MRVTKQSGEAGARFLGADPERSDHEIALIGRLAHGNPRLIHRLSLRVATLDDGRAFHRRLVAERVTIDEVITHGSAIGGYVFDPEGTPTEVFCLADRPCWVPALVPIDIEQPDDVVMARVDDVGRPLRRVPVGGEPRVAAASRLQLT